MTDTILVSHSQASVLERCEQKWVYSYVENLTKRTKSPNKAAHIGTLVHLGLDKLYSGSSEEEVRQAILNAADSAEEGSVALLLVVRYIRDFIPTADEGWTIAKTEDHFQIPLRTPFGRPYEFQGFIDLAAYQNDFLILWDHKSSGRNKYNKSQLATEWQLLLYGAAMRELGLEIDGIGVNGFNTQVTMSTFWTHPITKFYYRERISVTPQTFDNSLKSLGQTVDVMYDLAEGREPRMVLSKSCEWCDFQELCIYKLKGLTREVSDLKRIAFKQKETKHELKFQEGDGESTQVDYS